MAETEKITVNLNVVDLGKIDLIVSEGFYTNRTDFIRTAIRKELEVQKTHIDNTITRKKSVVGIQRYTAADLEDLRERGEMIDIRVVGYLHLANDISPELAEATINSIRVFGVMVTLNNDVHARLRELNRMIGM